jgi:ABC-type amino acid transport substrate-binding protein
VALPGHARVARRLALLAAAALLLLALAANAASIGALVDRLLHPPSLLDGIEAAGAISFGIRPDAPQVKAPAGGPDGFDVDVATALGRRLGVRADVAIRSPAEVLAAPGSGWQAAMPGLGIDPAAVHDVLVTRPYYRWPVYVVGRRGAAAASVGDLAGRHVCVVDGSPGAAWASGGGTGPVLEDRTPAPPVYVMTRPDQDGCIAALVAGAVDAAVTSTLLAGDLRTDGRLDLVGPAAVAVEPRAIVVPADAAGSGALRDALDEAIGSINADGTLADLARARFGTDEVVAAP